MASHATAPAVAACITSGWPESWYEPFSGASRRTAGVTGQLRNLPRGELGEDGGCQRLLLDFQPLDFFADVDRRVITDMAQFFDFRLEFGDGFFKFEKNRLHGGSWFLFGEGHIASEKPASVQAAQGAPSSTSRHRQAQDLLWQTDNFHERPLY